ncbi:PD-(D/E)XK nuclease family protein, partial [candidate division KSB1 bacterium]|nr:PD-(D/E)XK nuclease family protein [candidate division KSB1 bacterium]
MFYVGMTRAKKELYLTSGRDYGGARPRKVSVFVREALDDAHADEDFAKASAFEALARFDRSGEPIRPPAGEGHGESPAPETGPIPDDQLLYLDQNKIDDYLTCPLKYKYVHILRVPLGEYQAIIYGSALHAAVREYNRSKRKQEVVIVEDLLAVFKANWRSRGFLNREHEQQRFVTGQEVLRRFFEQQESEDFKPLYVEEPFKFMFENNVISGRWDRVDELPDGRVLIVDFKSSAVDDPEKARKRAMSSRQLRLYAWSYQERFGQPVAGWRMHFLESGMVAEIPLKEL